MGFLWAAMCPASTGNGFGDIALCPPGSPMPPSELAVWRRPWSSAARAPPRPGTSAPPGSRGGTHEAAVPHRPPPSLLHSEGSNLTPAHHFQDFRFKTYAPVAFRYFRELFGIRPDDYLVRASVSCCCVTSCARPAAHSATCLSLVVSVGQDFGCNSAGFFAQGCAGGWAGARASWGTGLGEGLLPAPR